MTIINLIFAPQEHDSANHQGLWEEIGRQSTGETIVIDISADLVVSILKRRFYRIHEAFRSPARRLDTYTLLRPFSILRPELLGPKLNAFNMYLLRRRLKERVPELESSEVRVLVYSGNWARTVHHAFPQAQICYYVIDEVTRTAATNAIHDRWVRQDQWGCQLSHSIFLMSPALAEQRKAFASKLKVVGNGAAYPHEAIAPLVRSGPQPSVGLIGNIRDWIDTALLESLIQLRPDIHFGIVGRVEDSMAHFIDSLISTYDNVRYYGSFPKVDIRNWYARFDVNIVPYQQNTFMFATRPIKIVESVFAGTPVVTIPVSGYVESDFVRFAMTPQEFSQEIDKCRPIDTQSHEYEEFLFENSWTRVARDILNGFD